VAIQSHGFFSDLRFPITIGLSSGFLSAADNREGRRTFLSPFVYNEINAFYTISIITSETLFRVFNRSKTSNTPDENPWILKS
jgi:hypothetical protein